VKIRAVDGLNALLDEEHWEAHIVSGHPEMQGNLDLVIGTLQNAAAVFRSKRDPETRIYLKEHASVTLGNRLIEQMTLRVYVRENDGFVVTAFFASAWSRGLGERIWPS
jgi:hypothetical protein